ncbi:MAG: hypothetical protein HZB20_10270 [Chloroflexi bacterium]|nr:hypothetical protein [Chloroflexota bacterium]
MDTEKLRVRLRKLEDTVHDLRHLPSLTLTEYLSNKDRQAIVERWLQIAAQVCVDVGASVVAEYGLAAPDDLPNIFVTLGIFERSTAGLVDFDDFGKAVVALIEKHESQDRESSE